jgi:hypothetical protein
MGMDRFRPSALHQGSAFPAILSCGPPVTAFLGGWWFLGRFHEGIPPYRNKFTQVDVDHVREVKVKG